MKTFSGRDKSVPKIAATRVIDPQNLIVKNLIIIRIEETI